LGKFVLRLVLSSDWYDRKYFYGCEVIRMMMALRSDGEWILIRLRAYFHPWL
jgi:hypothetical protein